MRREQVLQLLQDGAVIVDPGEDLLATAANLQQLGLIEAKTSTFVWCANPHDSDYSESDHYCRGRIDVPDNMEECFEDFYCPECERPVFPDVDEKERHRELLCEIVPAGVFGYLESLIKLSGLTTSSVCEGVARVDVGPLGVFVCAVDICSERKFLSAAWGATQPTCYVLVNAKAGRSYFHDESSSNHILLADLICNKIDLVKAVRLAIDSPPKRQPSDIIVPVVDRVWAPSSLVSNQFTADQRQFVVAVSNEGVWIEGLKVIGSRSPIRLTIFRLLWKSFVKDLFRETAPTAFRSQPLHTIRPLLESHIRKQYPDETTVRRLINRLQSDLETTVRRELGLPIGREDIVQTCVWQRQDATDFGYRLNPARVVVAAVPPSRR